LPEEEPECVFNHDKAQSVTEIPVEVYTDAYTDTDNKAGHFRVEFQNDLFSPNNITAYAWCIDIGREITTGSYDMDIFSAFDVDIHTDAVDKPEYFPNLAWLINNVNVGDMWPAADGCSGGEVTELQGAIWLLIDTDFFYNTTVRSGKQTRPKMTTTTNRQFYDNCYEYNYVEDYGYYYCYYCCTYDYYSDSCICVEGDCYYNDNYDDGSLSSGGYGGTDESAPSDTFDGYGYKPCVASQIADVAEIKGGGYQLDCTDPNEQMPLVMIVDAADNITIEYQVIVSEVPIVELDGYCDCPTEEPTPSPTESPTPGPTESRTPSPTESPTPSPTESPTPSPTEETEFGAPNEATVPSQPVVIVMVAAEENANEKWHTSNPPLWAMQVTMLLLFLLGLVSGWNIHYCLKQWSERGSYQHL